jgi:hypothetical protein
VARRLPSLDHVVLHWELVQGATRAAKNALITCALAFGRKGSGEREVLFAVAQSYTASRQTLGRDESAQRRVTEIDDHRMLRSELSIAEEQLCAAAKALSAFGRNPVGRLLRAASAYTHASEVERSCAARAAVGSPAERSEIGLPTKTERIAVRGFAHRDT